MKTILYVEQNYDGTVGGSHYCLLHLIKKLDREKYKPLVAFYEDNSLIGEFERLCNTVVIPLPKYFRIKPKMLQRVLNFFIAVAFVIRSIRFLRNNKVDLVHLNNAVMVGYDSWLLASFILHVPCITHDRSYTRLPTGWLFNRLRNRYRKVLAVSDVVRENIVTQGVNGDCVLTVYDGIDAAEYSARVKRKKSEVRDQFNISSSTYVIGMVGNIREWKGQELLIESLRLLKHDVPDFICILVGDVSKDSTVDVEYKQRLDRKIIQYGLSDRIVFTGYRSDVPDLLNIFDVQVNASISPDPFPHVILEGMSLGKVVVASNFGGAVESISDNVTGCLFSPDQPQQLAEKLRLVLGDGAKREKMGEAAFERVVHMFSIERNVAATECVYQEVVGS